VEAQDPNYSQFFSSPLTINPALTGDGENKWRIMSTLRNQTIGLGANYNTKTISADGKVYNNPESLTYVGIGGLFMTEDAMDGIYKSNYFNINSSVHITLDKNDYIHGLTFGLGWIYNKTSIDYSQLTTGQQLYSMGFNRTLPTGEPALLNIPGYSSLCAGIVYNFTTDDLVADFGISGYRFFNSKLSAFNDASQFTSPRYSAHFSIGKLMTDRLNLSMSGYYQTQNHVQGFTFGGHFGIIHSADEQNPRILNIGSYYRIGDALIPYLGYVFNDVEIGLSYDVKISQNKTGSVTPNSFEISFIYKNSKTSKNPLFW
jgi:type IX secretion system PorP/SprF family membrane protein